MAEASCRVFASLFLIGDRFGISPEEILEGTGLDVDFAEEEDNWASYMQVVQATEQLASRIGGPAELQDPAADTIVEVEGYAAMLAITRSMSGPKFLYRATARWISKQLWTMIDYTYLDCGEDRCELVLTFDHGQPPALAVLYMLAGTFQALPRILGYGDSEVSFEAQGQVVRFHMVTPRSSSVAAMIRRLLRRPFSGWGLFREQERQAYNLERALLEITHTRERTHMDEEVAGTVLAALGRDLERPIGQLVTGTNALLHQSLTPQQRELALANAVSSSRLGAVIEKLRQFTEVLSPGFEVAHAPFMPAQVLQEVEERVADTRLEIEAVPDGEVRGDPRWLGWLIHAMVDNALRHSRASCVRILVRRREDAWTFEIVDDGMGMDPNQVHRPFCNPEHRDNSLGLSLPIARRVVLRMGGTLEVMSSLGEGTSIRIAVPLEEPVAGSL